jgi:hypothetical protein
LCNKAHVGTNFCNCSLVLQDHLSTSESTIQSSVFSGIFWEDEKLAS